MTAGAWRSLTDDELALLVAIGGGAKAIRNELRELHREALLGRRLFPHHVADIWRLEHAARLVEEFMTQARQAYAVDQAHRRAMASEAAGVEVPPQDAAILAAVEALQGLGALKPSAGVAVAAVAAAAAPRRAA